MTEKNRIELHNILVEILGSNNVYFQPPTNIHLKFPCIIYDRDNAKTEYSNNRPYALFTKYTVTYISDDPDGGETLRDIAMLPMCSYGRHFVVDGLHHDTFTLYYK